jgi:hypothetical protein
MDISKKLVFVMNVIDANTPWYMDISMDQVEQVYDMAASQDQEEITFMKDHGDEKDRIFNMIEYINGCSAPVAVYIQPEPQPGDQFYLVDQKLAIRGTEV